MPGRDDIEDFMIHIIPIIIVMTLGQVGLMAFSSWYIYGAGI